MILQRNQKRWKQFCLINPIYSIPNKEQDKLYPFSAMPTPSSYHRRSPSVMHLNTTGLLWFLKGIGSTINGILVSLLFVPSPYLWLLLQQDKLAHISDCHAVILAYLLNHVSCTWPPVPPLLAVSLDPVQHRHAVAKLHLRAAACS